MSNWKSFSLSIPGKDLLEPVRQVLETLVIFLDVLKVILDTIKAFLIDFGNPIKALVQALIKLIEELFLALKASGFFGYFDVPTPETDPAFARHAGGYPAFTQRFKASLFDTKDFNRPQPRQGSTKSGFVLMVVDAGGPIDMVRRIRNLLKFFGKALSSPHFSAPANFKVLPVGSSGDPILAVAHVFTKGPINAIELQWTLPSTQETPTPGFSDVVMKYASEFIPPSFVIEKSTDVNPASQKISLSDMADPDTTGIVEWNRPVNVDPALASRFATTENGRVVRKEVLKDESGEPVIKFQKYVIPGTGVDLLGQLGKFRYVDTDVIPGRTYYYRVRAYSGSLDVDPSTGLLNNVASSASKLAPKVGDNSSIPHFDYPSKTKDDSVVMGKPTPIIRTTIPTATDFDVLENARRIFLTAFSLDFHQELPQGLEFNSDGTPKNGTTGVMVGRGSLFDQSGILASFLSLEVLDELAKFETVGAALDPANQVIPLEMPWTKFNVRRQAARLADGVVTSMLQFPESVTTFRDLMRGSPPPRGPIDTGLNLSGKDTLEDIVFELTKIEDPGVTSTFTGGTVSQSGVQTYVAAYQDVPLRLNILTIVNFLKTFTLGGTPVDWISIQPLRDIIPWSGQFLYDLLDKIQALIDAFNGTLEEIRQFIDMLERKINALEAFIQFLIDILDFIESLSLDFYLLAVNGIDGDAFAWVEALDSAGGTKPPSGPGGYTAGICLAYVAPDIGIFATALSIIFGG